VPFKPPLENELKSTIKKTFDRTVTADGSVVLSYKGGRLSAHSVGKSAILALPVLFGAGYLGFGIFYVLDLMAPRSDITGYIACILTFAGIYLFFKKVFGSRMYKLTMTKEGLIFPKSSFGSATSQLPYADIDNLGITTESSNHKAGFTQSCNIYAATGGTNVKITRFIPETLADALVKEIQSEASRLEERQAVG
jgi:hypothetical protein